MPSLAPKTTTRSHSRPFTRWMVLSVTPPSACTRWKVARSHGLERPGVGVQVGHLEEGLQVVEVGAGGAAAAVEQGHRRAEADVVAHGGEQVAGRRAAAGQARQAIEVGGEVVELGRDLHVVDPAGGLADVGDRAAPVEELRGPLGQPPTGAAVDLGQVSPVHGVGVRRRCAGRPARPARPRRASTLSSRMESIGTPASVSATWGASSSDCTRASTATCGAARRPARRASPGPPRPAPRRRRRRRACRTSSASGRWRRRGRAGSPWRRGGRL